VWLQPEAGGSYTAFIASSCDACQLLRGKHPVRVFGGARIGGAGLVAGVIEPSLFGHAGYGWVRSDLAGPALDVGFSVDVKLVRYFRFGAHGAYNVVVTPQSADYMSAPSPSAEKWISYGLHAGVAI
jgi:hypothetical protein